MKKTITKRCSSPIWLLLMTTLLLSFMIPGNYATAQVNMPGIAPVLIPAGGFGVDGDAEANFPTPAYSNTGDWFSDPAYPGTGGTIYDMTTPDPDDFIPALVSPVIMAAHYNDPYEGTDPTTFPGSNKINDDPETYTWGPGSANSPAKNEINNATVAFVYGDPALGGDSDDLWALIAGDRATVNGSSYIDFEFLQNTLTMTGINSGSFISEGPDGGRTEGDVLVTLEFINGGNVAIVVINVWTETDVNVYEYVPQDINDYAGMVFSTANLVTTQAPWMPFGQPQYEVNQYAEAAVNLTDLFGFDETGCGYISTVFVRTRTSGNSSQSELSDLPGPPFQINISISELAAICPDPVSLPACSSDEAILAAYTAWVAGFSVTGTNNPVGNFADIPALPADVQCDGADLTFTLIATNDCEMVDSCYSTFFVAPDTEAPVLAAAPGPVTVQCLDDVPAMTSLAWTDNCDSGGSVLGVDGPLIGGECGGTITRTWNVMDACENAAITRTQIITVDDNTAPVLAAAPGPVTVQCLDDVPAMTSLAWTDNCDSGGSVLGVDGPLIGGECGGTITRTWNVMDACENAAITRTQIITVDDNTAPVLAAAPGPVTVQCLDDVPAMTSLAWTDNCDMGGSVLGVDGPLIGGECGGTITRTWNVMDACDNPAITRTQIITVDDNIAPVLAAAPGPVTVQCLDDVPAITSLAWTDNCDMGGSVLGVDGPLIGGECGGTITRTWNVMDACDNPAITRTQIITVDDNIAPVLAAAPGPVTVQCLDDVPAMTSLAWTDNCDMGGSVLGVDGPLIGGECGGTITRTWNVMDACDNPAITRTQIITVDDNTAPVLAAAPGPVTVQCLDDVPVMTSLAWTDNCDMGGSVLGVDGPLIGGECGGTITRTWNVMDACDNPAITRTQIITVDDNTAPVLAAAPGPVTVQCIDDVPVMTSLAWTDNCDMGGSVLGVDGPLIGGECGGTITRTWNVMDACDNPAITRTQIITVDDNTAPVLAAAPDDITVQCIEDVPAMTSLAWTDNCDMGGTVLGVDGDLIGGECGGTITRTWNVMDACDNPAITRTQIITVDDDIAPVIVTEITDLTFECAEDVVLPVVEFSDNCGLVETICEITGWIGDCDDYVFVPGTDTEVCFSAMDDCENVSEVACITITVLPCDSDFCTLTQGAYGNEGGIYCDGSTTTELLNSLLTTNLVLGMNNRTFTVPAGASQCVIDILPGGGSSIMLPVGTWGCGNLGNLVDKQGRLKNALLAQAITLGLNMRLDTDLANLEFTNAEFYIMESSGCGEEGAYPIGEPIYYTGMNAMPASIMSLFGGNPTVMEIYNLANQALGGVSVGVPLADITKAMGLINDALDECAFIFFLPPAQSQPVSGTNDEPLMSLKVTPNPFNHEAIIAYQVEMDSKVSIEIYNMQGAKVSTLYSGEAKGGLAYNLKYVSTDRTEQMMVIVMRSNYGTISEKIINIK